MASLGYQFSFGRALFTGRSCLLTWWAIVSLWFNLVQVLSYLTHLQPVCFLLKSFNLLKRYLFLSFPSAVSTALLLAWPAALLSEWTQNYACSIGDCHEHERVHFSEQLHFVYQVVCQLSYSATVIPEETCDQIVVAIIWFIRDG